MLNVDIGYRVSIETKSCPTPYRPPLLFFFYFLMIVRPGRAPLVLKEEEEEENHRRRGHPDLVTTYDCGFFFFISPRRFPPFAVEGKTRGSVFHRSTAESVS